MSFTIDSLCQIIRSVSSAVGADSVVIQAERENAHKKQVAFHVSQRIRNVHNDRWHRSLTKSPAPRG
jgi:hypothetical protein